MLKSKNIYSFFYKNIKLIIIFSLIIILLIFNLWWNQNNISEMVNDIKKIMVKRGMDEGLFYLDSSKLYNIKNGEKKLVGIIKMLGWVNGYFHFTSSNNYQYKIFNYGICNSKSYSSPKNNIDIFNCNTNIELKHLKSEQLFIVSKTGTYKIELWGASGGISSSYIDVSDKIGKGAYVKGDIYLKKGTILSLHIGGKGNDGIKIKDSQRFTPFGYPSRGGAGGYNGGGSGFDDPESNAGGGGGGATDIRLVMGKWNDFASLKSRIMVAAGGGGMSRYYVYRNSAYEGSGTAGSGGAIKGIDGYKTIEYLSPYGYGATQTNGYKLGQGQDGLWCITTLNGLGGGGGGYLGAYSGMCNNYEWMPSGGAGGGSSYVSGCKGCISINEKSKEENLKFDNKSIHYSNKKFTNIKMISGNKQMPNFKGGVMIGNNGDGYAKISYLHR